MMSFRSEPSFLGGKFLEIEIDLFDVERDVLFRLGPDVLGQGVVIHDLQADFLDDHRVAGDGNTDFVVLDLEIFQEGGKGFADRFGVLQNPVLDRTGRNRGCADGQHLVAFAGLLQLTDFSRRGSRYRRL
jgi:hypothetical protein